MTKANDKMIYDCNCGKNDFVIMEAKVRATAKKIDDKQSYIKNVDEEDAGLFLLTVCCHCGTLIQSLDMYQCEFLTDADKKKIGMRP